MGGVGPAAAEAPRPAGEERLDASAAGALIRRFVLLDRDGTINVDVGYLADPDGLELVPGSLEALRLLRDAGFGLALVTNQSGIARGFLDEEVLSRIHARLAAVLAEGGVTLDGIYVCVHGPEDGCACRKPATELVERAVREHGFEPSRAFVVGDKAADVKLAHAIGARGVLVRTGYGAAVEMTGIRADAIVDDLLAAARWILEVTARETTRPS